MLDQARALGPTIAARSDEIEAHRTLPLDVVDMIRPTGAFRQYVPAALDGPAVDAVESLRVIEEFAYHDGAVGWCVMIGSTTSLMSSHLPEEFGRELFADPAAIGGGFAAPNGRATVIDGGLRVTGTWQWGSGTRHCSTIGGGCLIVDADGKPAPRDDGLTAPFVFFDRADVEFVDNWHVSGLSGSGSGDYSVTDAFVPEGRWAQVGLHAPTIDNPLARFSFLGLLASGVAAAALGIARRSIDELVALAETKRPQGSKRTLRDRTQVQADVAAAEAMQRSAWALLAEANADAWATAIDGGTPTLEQKRMIRLAATHATQTAAAVTELMYKAAGGAAVYRTSPIQRCFRDVHVATQHAMVAPRTFELTGRMRLGLETNASGL